MSDPQRDDWLDQTRPVRPGETLYTTRLATFLANELGLTGPIAVEQFPSGYSNLTYLVRVGERELVLRRPPVGSTVKTAHDMGREYRILSRLHDVFPAAPKPLVACDDPTVIGAPFYVMERIRGVILRRRLPAGFDFNPERARSTAFALVDQLAALHAVDYRAAGLADLGKPAGYIERQVRGWSERWRKARLDEVPAIERMSQWLLEHLPAEVAPALIHNDFKYDNVVLDPAQPTRILGVLDWEMATLGDPLMDLGTMLGYWIQADDPAPMKAAAFGPTDVPGSPTRHELGERYGEQFERRTGQALPALRFYYCFALFKSAVVVQQIYLRYRQGLTQDARFAGLGAMVELLGATAEQATVKGP